MAAPRRYPDDLRDPGRCGRGTSPSSAARTWGLVPAVRRARHLLPLRRGLHRADQRKLQDRGDDARGSHGCARHTPRGSCRPWHLDDVRTRSPAAARPRGGQVSLPAEGEQRQPVQRGRVQDLEVRTSVPVLARGGETTGSRSSRPTSMSRYITKPAVAARADEVGGTELSGVVRGQVLGEAADVDLHADGPSAVRLTTPGVLRRGLPPNVAEHPTGRAPSARSGPVRSGSGRVGVVGRPARRTGRRGPVQAGAAGGGGALVEGVAHQRA